MEAFLNSGFFWGLIAIAFAAFLGVISNLPEKKEQSTKQPV